MKYTLELLLFIMLVVTSSQSQWETNVVWGLDNRAGDFFFVNPNTGWCLFSEHQGVNTTVIHKTTNKGINWFQIYNFNSAPFSFYYAPGSIYFLNSQTGWVSFSKKVAPYDLRGYLYKTYDGGASWTLLKENSDVNSMPFSGKVFFVDANTGYYIAPRGLRIWKSTNGGTNWVAKWALGVTGSPKVLTDVGVSKLNSDIPGSSVKYTGKTKGREAA